jgi:hypothetical protein
MAGPEKAAPMLEVSAYVICATMAFFIPPYGFVDDAARYLTFGRHPDGVE